MKEIIDLRANERDLCPSLVDFDGGIWVGTGRTDCGEGRLGIVSISRWVGNGAFKRQNIGGRLVVALNEHTSTM
jgi:hypothetical protein